MRHFGLIGNPLAHSFSPSFFKAKFQREGIDDASYEAVVVEEMKSLPDLVASKQWSGFNITIPFKKKIQTYLSEISPEARAIGAVNCVKVNGDFWTGHNTDAMAFEASLLGLLDGAHPEKALVMGTGGSAAAIYYTLAKLNIPFKSVSRTDKGDLTYAEISSSLLQETRLVINCTPLGTHPDVNACPNIPYEALTERHFLFDLVYNPEQTLFLKRGLISGAKTRNGLGMLHLQAEKSWEIWNNN